MQALENEFENYLNDVRGLKTGRLSIGSNNAFSALVLPQIISEFNRLYPGVEVRLTEGNIYYLEELLARGEVDLVLDNHPMDEKVYQKEHSFTEHLLLAVPTEGKTLPDGALSHQDILRGWHLQADAPAVSIDLFRDSSFIALRHGNDTRIRMDQLCEQAGFVPHIQLEVDQLSTAYNIVCSNMGLTLVSDTLISRTAPGAADGLLQNQFQPDRALRLFLLQERRLCHAGNAGIYQDRRAAGPAPRTATAG